MRLAVIVLLVATVACGRRVNVSSAPGCAGQHFAVVTNNLDQAVDIRANVSGSSTPVTLGTVNGRERREFVLPTGASGVYPYSGSRGMSSEARDRVQIRYECRR